MNNTKKEVYFMVCLMLKLADISHIRSQLVVKFDAM